MAYRQIQILGRSVGDAQRQVSKAGKEFTKLTVAINEKSKNEMKSTFYNVIIFEKTPKAAELIKKGDSVFVAGKPEEDVYINEAGEAKIYHNVVADNWQLVR